MGDLNDIAREDARNFLGGPGGFSDVVTIQNNISGEEIVTEGVHTKHHMNYDAEGMMVNTKMASVAISELPLTEADPPFSVRNNNGEVSMVDFRVSVADSTGEVKEYVVKESYPDEKLGLIVLMLGDFKPV